jgi:hypothetical protein
MAWTALQRAVGFRIISLAMPTRAPSRTQGMPIKATRSISQAHGQLSRAKQATRLIEILPDESLPH